MKNAIVILNLVGLPKIVPVESLSDENIKKAISKTLRVDLSNVERLTNQNPAIYGIKELYPTLQRALESVNIYYSEYPAKHSHYVQVLYADM